MANSNNNKDYNDNRHLFYLDELSDYKVASDDPDVRGWDVKDSGNRVIGKVDNLLVNKDSNRVVYLDVEVDKSIIDAEHKPYGAPANGDVHEFINKEGENHIIIPVGLVSLNEDDNFVYTDRINHETFASTKRYKKGTNVDRDYEVVVLKSYDRNKEGNTNKNQTGRTTGAAAAGATSTNIGSTNTGRVAGESPAGAGTGRNMGAADRTGTTDTNRSENVAGLNRDKRDERSDVNNPAGDSPVRNRDVTDKTTSATRVENSRQKDSGIREDQRENSSAVGNAANKNYRSESREGRTGDEQLGTEGVKRERSSATDIGSGERGRAADQDLREGAERRGRADENLRRGDDGTFYERTEFDDKNFKRRNKE